MDHLLHASINGICCVGYEESEFQFNFEKEKDVCGLVHAEQWYSTAP